jgi:hypothetical protein
MCYFTIKSYQEEFYLLGHNHCFARTCCLHLQGQRISQASHQNEAGSMQEVKYSLKILADFQQTTWCYISEIFITTTVRTSILCIISGMINFLSQKIGVIKRRLYSVRSVECMMLSTFCNHNTLHFGVQTPNMVSGSWLIISVHSMSAKDHITT